MLPRRLIIRPSHNPAAVAGSGNTADHCCAGATRQRQWGVVTDILADNSPLCWRQQGKRDGNMRRKGLTLLASVLVLLCTMIAPRAADYPTRPIVLVVAFPPGGASDVLARILGRKLEQILRQPVVIDNRPGAGGNVAAEAVAHAAPDGYTLLAGNNAILATNAALYKKINFDAEADFAPIGLIGSQANILVVNPAVPARSMAELIALAKANPGKLNFASSGHGLAAHLAGELFKTEAKIDLIHVPYKGAAPALQDVIAGHVQMMFATASSVVAHINEGKVRALAVTTLKRTAVLPEIATIDELGIKGFDATTWHGLVAPARTPKEIVAALNRALTAALDDAAVKKPLADLGVDIMGGGPEDFAAYIRSEIPKWTAIVKASGAKLD
jgi:tripartite-type tricarboxylate transporter receptor subunit TctC